MGWVVKVNWVGVGKVEELYRIKPPSPTAKQPVKASQLNPNKMPPPEFVCWEVQLSPPSEENRIMAWLVGESYPTAKQLVRLRHSTL
jgi:hypothetical protein